MTVPRNVITKLLRDWSNGDETALHELMPLVHKELQLIARAYLARERHAYSWQPTVLVNEAFLRLVNCRDVNWQDRSHFFRLAAKKMRQILVDYARKKRLEKQGGGQIQIVPIDDAHPAAAGSQDAVDLILLSDALDRLEALDPRKAEIVEQRFSAGLSIEEIAKNFGIAVSTVHRDLHLGKVWLLREIQGEHHES